MSSNSLLPLASTFTTFPSINTQPRVFKTRTYGLRVSCNGAPNNNNNDNQLILPETQKLILPNVDRRNLLVGIGGLYTATSLPAALAVPIEAPNDITKSCKEATTGFTDAAGALRTRKCCLTDIGKTVQPYVLPTQKTVRKRWPAHKGTPEQVADYIAAIQAMRDLDKKDPSHPHSFSSQAKIHCAYCHGSYTQDGQEIQIHDSWLFFPFHRWYLYFYERILGKLIGKPDTFALPYWQWEDPEGGMQIPNFFLGKQLANGKENPLYDVYRDAIHMGSKSLVDLNYHGKDMELPNDKQTQCNLSTVYRDLVKNGGTIEGFFGGKYVAGNNPSAKAVKRVVGSVEAGCHTAVHRWVGDRNNPNNEDMGRFYSAGYDPVFYVHHANVDRMWKLWKELGRGDSALRGHVDPTEDDWLNASYVFYDENEDLVRVTNKDTVDLDKLGYNYIEEKSKQVLPWQKARPLKRNPSSQVAPTVDVPKVEQLKFPVTLDKILKVRVKRPAVNRTDTQKGDENECLGINDIKFDCEKFVKFDVFVNDKLKPGIVTTPCDPEYAGGFTQIPHGNSGNEMSMSIAAARFGLTELLEDTNTEGEEYATVTLVPRVGCEDVTIGEIEIELIPRPKFT